jgi:hypothetical protein
MRLEVLDRGHRARARLFLAAVGRMSGVDMPDVVTMLLYRPDFLGRPLVELTADAMRGPSFWTVPEREYLAASIAKLFRLQFCIDAHSELTRLTSGGALDVDDTAGVRPELLAAREFVEALARTPADVRPANLPEPAVRDALRVGLVWGIVNRLGSAFGFVLRDEQLEPGTKALNRTGYRLPGFLVGRRGRGDLVANLRHAVFESDAVTPRVLRRAAGAGDPVDEPWPGYVAKVRANPELITDADVAALGRPEDEIFEVTAAAAVGAALDSYVAGLRTITG